MSLFINTLKWLRPFDLVSSNSEPLALRAEEKNVVFDVFIHF